MQKKLLASLLYAVLTTSSFAGTGPFNGFYAGAALGGENMQVDDDSTIQYFLPVVSPLFTNINLLLPNSPRVYDDSLTGGLNIGYARTMYQNFLLGIEARANFENLKTKYAYSNQTSTTLPQVIPGININSDDSVELKNDFSLLIKLGMVLQSRTLIYGLIGPTWGNFDTSTDVTASLLGVQTKIHGGESEYQTGWLAGLGIEYLLTDHFSLALEYSHADYGSFESVDETVAANTPPLVLGTGAFLSVDDDVNAKTDSVVFRLTYYFTPSSTKIMKN